MVILLTRPPATPPAGPRTATAIGPLSVVGLVHHQPHVNDPADVLVQWADAVGNLEGVALAITAGDTLAISIAHSRVPETFPLQSKYIGIAERPRAPRDPRMSAKLIAKKKEVTAVDPVISGLLRRVTSASALDNLVRRTRMTHSCRDFTISSMTHMKTDTRTLVPRTDLMRKEDVGGVLHPTSVPPLLRRCLS